MIDLNSTATLVYPKSPDFPSVESKQEAVADKSLAVASLADNPLDVAPNVSITTPDYPIANGFDLYTGDRHMFRFKELLGHGKRSVKLPLKALRCQPYPDPWAQHNHWGYIDQDSMEFKHNTAFLFDVDRDVVSPVSIDYKARKLGRHGATQHEGRATRFRPLTADNLKNDDLEDGETFLDSLYQFGFGIYAGIHAVRDSKQETTPHVLVFEFDDRSITDQIAIIDSLPLKPNFYVTTGKSVHAYFIVDNMTLEDRLNLQRRLVAHLEGSDTKVCDLARVLRVPGYHHVKYIADRHEFVATMCLLYERSPNPYSVAEIEDWLPQLPASKSRKSQHASQNNARGDRQHADSDRQRTIHTGKDDSDLSIARLAAKFVPVRESGKNTYDVVTQSYWAVKNTFGQEIADELLEDKFGDLSDGEIDRMQKGDYPDFTLGTLFKHAQDNGFEFPTPSSGKTKIYKPTPNEMDDVALRILSELANMPNHLNRLYVQGSADQGVSPIWVKSEITKNKNSGSGLAIEQLMTVADWQALVNCYYLFYTEKGEAEKADDDEREKKTEVNYFSCPYDLAARLKHLSHQTPTYELKGFTSVPIVRGNGSIFLESGYDEETKNILQCDRDEFSALNPTPTRDDAIAAIARIKEVLDEFTFEREVDRSAALSLLLTAATRSCYTTAPLHAINAASPGTGKSTLAFLASRLLLSGSGNPSVVTWATDPQELDKRIFSSLLCGAKVINLDNCNGVAIRGGTLETCLTSPYFKSRILGASKMQTVPTQALWMANGNNLIVSNDMIRRSILINLTSPFENAAERKFKRDLSKYVIDKREELVCDLLTISMAYLQAGKPLNNEVRGDFTDWQSYVAKPLVWCGERDPIATQTDMLNQDPDRTKLADFLRAIHEVYGSKPWLLNIVTKQEFMRFESPLRLWGDEYCSTEKDIAKLGYWLRAKKGVQVNGLVLAKGEKTRCDNPWLVKTVA